MAVPQRLLFRDAAAVNTNHTISFTYQYTKAGIHAFDFLTTVNPKLGIAQGNSGFIPGTPVLNPCGGLNGQDLSTCNALNPASATPIQIPIPNDPFDSKDASPTGQTDKENAYEAATAMDRYISAYVRGGTVTFGTPTLAHSSVGANSDSGDTEVTITIPFTTNGCAQGDSCDILMYFGGHLAVTGDGNGDTWGPGLGSSQINGGPYHIKGVKFDGTGGSQDNQVKGADILLPPAALGTIIIKKETVPDGNTTDFTFNPSWSAQDFVLSDGEQSDSSELEAGVYSVVETVPAGWVQTSATCDDGSPVGAIDLGDGETVTCTFTNTLQTGSITIVKETIGGNGAFSFVGELGAFELTTVSNTANQVFGNLLPDTYTVAETVPDGWELTSATCSDGSPVNAIALSPNENVTCTFTNTKDGSITIVKEVVGADKDFSFTGEVNASLGDGESETVSVAPGGYSVTEGADAAYALTSLVCDDQNSTENTGTRTATINVEAGEAVTCTFTNSELPTLTLVKTVDNNDGGSAVADDFQAYINGNEVPWSAAQTLTPNSYTASEDTVDGYTAGAWGDDCADNGTVSLAYGEHKTCTVINTDDTPTLKLVKTVEKNNGGNEMADNWTLTATAANPDDARNISTLGGSDDFSPIFADTVYSLGETGPGGYSAGAWSCDAGSLEGNTLTVELGEAVTCTIVNDDIAPTITLIKDVITDHGGDAAPDDFGLTIGGSAALSGVSYNAMANTPIALNEASLTGYTFVEITGDAKCPALLGGTVTLDEGENITCTIVNDDQPAEIHGMKFEDKNGNGTKDDGDTGLSGWTIYLDFDGSGSQDGDEPSTTTAGDGSYSFTGLSVGTYKVREVQQAGWTQTTANPSDVVLANADIENDVNFGNFKLVSITGKKFNDDEGDGSIAGDPILSDWTIRLYKVVNNVWTLVDTDTTDGAGAYNFDNLPVGSYKVCEVLQAGWIQTFSSIQGANTSPDADEEGQWCNTKNVTTSGNNPSAGNFGNYQAKALTVEKTAATTFTRTYGWTIDKSVTPDTIDMFTGDSADVEYTVTLTKDDGTDSNFAVTGNITITNPNPVSTGLDATIEGVTDAMGDIEASVECPSDTVVAGGSIVCTYSSTLPDAENRTNTATVVTSGIVGGGADDVAVTFDLNNPTNEVNDTVNVDDTNDMSWEFSDDGVQKYEDTFTCNADEGEHSNTVTIEETDQSASADVTVNCHELEVTKTADTSYIRTFDWEITKTVDEDELHLFTGDEATVEYTVVATKLAGVDSGFAGNGTISVHNPAPITATLSGVNDVVTGAGALAVDCEVPFPYQLLAGATLECTYAGALPDKESRLNTATAVLQNAPQGTTDFSGTAQLTFSEPDELINDTVEVTDTYEASTVGEVSDTTEFTYSREFACVADVGNGTGAGTYPNTAKITETEDEASASVEVDCYDLTVSKTANTSYTKTWNWSIEKTSNISELVLSPGQEYPVDYDVTVSATSANSDYAATGTITISNPAPMDATLTSVEDVLTGDITATVICQLPLVVPKGGSIQCGYGVALDDATTLTNTATVELENGTKYSGTAEVDFAHALVTEIDESIDVVDDKAGPLGTVLATEAPKTFEYTLNVGPYEIEACGTVQEFDNTATLTTNDNGTTVDDTWTVDATVRCTCSLTQGYWKTHNDTFHGGAPADENWFNLGPLGELTIFFAPKTTATWYTTFWTAPKGNVYYNMAHQYMAAKLNVLNGAYNPTINAQLSAAETLLNTYTPAQIAALKGKNATLVSKQFNELAGKFGAFNEGTTNPAGHCSEPPL
jgi:hypothetical protein